MERLIFHIDVNSAFLSWEAARRVKQGLPDLREIPACIGGDEEAYRYCGCEINPCKEIRYTDGRTHGNGSEKMSEPDRRAR